jgi:CDP-alcohol phosphatidyltransferase
MVRRSLKPTFTLVLLLLVASCPLPGRAFAPISVRPLFPPRIAYPSSSPSQCLRHGDCPSSLYKSQLAASSKLKNEGFVPPESYSTLKKKNASVRDRIPMWLTYSRCVMIPVLVYVFYRPQSHVLAPIIFGAASFTDWLDGYLARRWNVESSFGAFLDPVVCCNLNSAAICDWLN